MNKKSALLGLIRYLSIGLILISHATLTRAVPITYNYIDPVGDNATTIDLIGMDFEFENSTGDYTITMRASATNPFFGMFRLNVNIFNPDTGTTAPNPAFFQDTLNNFNLAAPLTEIVLTGTNTHLLNWSLDDTIAVSTDNGLGNPDGSTRFQTGVGRLDGLPPRDGFCNEDFIAPGSLFTECLSPTGSIPAPTTIFLFGIGLAGLGWSRRKNV